MSFLINTPAAGLAEPCNAVSIATDSDGSAHVVYNRAPVGEWSPDMAKRLDIYYFKVDSSGAVLKDTQIDHR